MKQPGTKVTTMKPISPMDMPTLTAPRMPWAKTRERNEALDCRVYARAAAAALGMDGWGDGRWWARMADALSLPAAEPAPTTGPAAATASPEQMGPRGWLAPRFGWLR